MALYDHQQAELNLQARQSYTKLKEWLRTKEHGEKLNEFFPAVLHIEDMERTIAEQELQLKEYRNFFSSLSMLLPKQPSIHDVIF